MFSGFSDETFEFFMAIRFNNNREFFQTNHDWYLRSVREPALALAEALQGVIEQIDPDLDRRPNRALSRINRDIRFSRDKSPYRDYFWISFHAFGEDRHSRPGFYFDMGTDGGGCCMGMYEENAGIMAGLRRDAEQNPEPMLSALAAVNDAFHLEGRPIKRMKIPEGISPAIAPYYALRGFFLEDGNIPVETLKSADLVPFLTDRFLSLAPLYKYLNGLANRA